MACEALLEAPGRSAADVPSGRPAPSRIYEPALEELFAEPIMQQLMRSDGLDEETIRRLLRQAAAARGENQADDRRGRLRDAARS